jgi:putative ABC transport system permease protein
MTLSGVIYGENLPGSPAPIAVVSLIVDGIGTMNIMLVLVNERTREIGIHLAIGALEREALTQFWVESVAFPLSADVGVVFGYFPALKSACLHPIEALRYECDTMPSVFLLG